jgi:molybdate transport system regulatory protein
MPVRKPQRRNHTIADAGDRSPSRQQVWANMLIAQIHTKVWVDVDGRFALGDGGAGLLRAIAEERSLTKAAARVGWSYKHAWTYLRRAERTLEMTLTETSPGKGKVRGMVLTTAGHLLVSAMELARNRAHDAAHSGWQRAMSPVTAE